MPIESCIPIIPSANLETSLRLWVDGLGFSMSSEMRKDDKLICCMLRKDKLCFMLNQRAGTPVTPEDYEGIRLYWAPKDIHKTRERLKSLGYGVSEIEHRDYGQTEFLTCRGFVAARFLQIRLSRLISVFDNQCNLSHRVVAESGDFG